MVVINVTKNFRKSSRVSNYDRRRDANKKENFSKILQDSDNEESKDSNEEKMKTKEERNERSF
jgi:hypothetical protein